MTSVVLGLDVSPLRLGWGIVTLEEGRAVACGMERIDLPHNGWMHQQVRNALHVAVPAWGPLREVCFVAIEKPALPRQSGTGSAMNAGRAMQEAVNACQRRWPHAPIEELQPAGWRRRAGIKGNATKEEVFAAAVRLWADAGLPAEVTSGWAQDAADALLIAAAGFHCNEEINEVAVARARR